MLLTNRRGGVVYNFVETYIFYFWIQLSWDCDSVEGQKLVFAWVSDLGTTELEHPTPPWENTGVWNLHSLEQAVLGWQVTITTRFATSLTSLFLFNFSPIYCLYLSWGKQGSVTEELGVAPGVATACHGHAAACGAKTYWLRSRGQISFKHHFLIRTMPDSKKSQKSQESELVDMIFDKIYDKIMFQFQSRGSQ